MKLNEYQELAREYDTFADQSSEATNPAMMAKILGLAGETGEVCEKFKKILRDKDGMISEEDKADMTKELGDVLWYLATIGRYLNIDLEAIAEINIDKLKSRKARNKLTGNGDNR